MSPPPSSPAASSGLESEAFGDAEGLANHMGLFLQKTNIIRDYLVGATLRSVLMEEMIEGGGMSKGGDDDDPRPDATRML